MMAKVFPSIQGLQPGTTGPGSVVRVGTFGERLRREREMRGITLDEIAEATKIGVRSLRALEQEQFEKLPGGIFNKGFVRAYARFLGIDEEQAVADYLSASEDKEESSTPEKKPGKLVSVEKTETRPETAESAGPPWRVAAVIVLVAVLAAGGWYAYNRWRTQHEGAAALASEPPPVSIATPQSTPAPDTAAIATPTTPPTASPASPDLTSAAPPAADNKATEFVVVVHAVQDSWMKISADGKLVMAGEVLKASGQKEVRAQKEIVLTVGNAGGVEVSHNGKALASLGPENKTRTVTFTPDGMQR